MQKGAGKADSPTRIFDTALYAMPIFSGDGLWHGMSSTFHRRDRHTRCSSPNVHRTNARHNRSTALTILSRRDNRLHPQRVQLR